LVVFQFSISIVMLVGTFVVHNQLEYIRNKNLGFEKEQLLVIQRAENLDQNKEAFRNELLSSNDVMNVAFSNSVPGRHLGDFTHLAEGAPAEEIVRMFLLYGDFNYFDTLRMEMIEGRYFSKDRPADRNSVILNETAAAALGMGNPVGKRLIRSSPAQGGSDFFTIIGVVKDFHFESLHQKIRPLAVYLLTEDEARYVTIRVRPDNIPKTLSFIKSQWNEFVPRQPFEYFFIDDDFDSLYKTEQKVGQIFSAFAILAVLVACLGLFGLASFTAEQRTKEIGIRKILGATVSNILTLLTREFSRWVLLANLVAWPIAYFAMYRWLQNFAYRISIGPRSFLLAAGMVFFVALFAVSYQALRSAIASPVDALKHE